MTSNNDWENFLDTAIPQLLDRKPITFNRQHKVISKSLVKFFNKKNGEILTLKHTMIRNRFLYHCHLLTKNESIEYAIIGYGKKRGQGTDIKKVQVIKGEYDNVSIPQSTFNRIDKLFNQNLKNEVVIFHNHPGNIQTFLDLDPLPSNTDRDTMINQKIDIYYLIRIYFSKGGGIKFFLGDHKRVREFRIPRTKKIIEILKALGIIDNRKE